MNLMNSGLIQNLISSDIPRLCRALPDLVNALAGLRLELKELREVMERIESKIEKEPDE